MNEEADMVGSRRLIDYTVATVYGGGLGCCDIESIGSTCILYATLGLVY